MKKDTKVTVHDAMTLNVLTADPKTSVAETALLMAKFKMGCLIVKGTRKLKV